MTLILVTLAMLGVRPASTQRTIGFVALVILTIVAILGIRHAFAAL